MTVDVVQYKRPDGREVYVTTELPDVLRPQYQRLLERGWRFAAEVLTTDEISISIEDPIKEEDVDIRIVENGPSVQEALAEMLKEVEAK